MRHVVVTRTAVDVSFTHVTDIEVFTGALEDILSAHCSMHLNALVIEEKHRPTVSPSPTPTVATNVTHHTSDICCNGSHEIALILCSLLGVTSLLVTQARLACVGV